jgi:hypothetical protein
MKRRRTVDGQRLEAKRSRKSPKDPIERAVDLAYDEFEDRCDPNNELDLSRMQMRYGILPTTYRFTKEQFMAMEKILGIFQVSRDGKKVLVSIKLDPRFRGRVERACQGVDEDLAYDALRKISLPAAKEFLDLQRYLKSLEESSEHKVLRKDTLEISKSLNKRKTFLMDLLINKGGSFPTEGGRLYGKREGAPSHRWLYNLIDRLWSIYIETTGKRPARKKATQYKRRYEGPLLTQGISLDLVNEDELDKHSKDLYEEPDDIDRPRYVAGGSFFFFVRYVVESLEKNIALPGLTGYSLTQREHMIDHQIRRVLKDRKSPPTPTLP